MKIMGAALLAAASLVLAGCSTGADDVAGANTSSSSTTTSKTSTARAQQPSSTTTSPTPATSSRPDSSAQATQAPASPSSSTVRTPTADPSKTESCTSITSGKSYPCTPAEYRKLANTDEQDTPQPGDRVESGNETLRICLDPIEDTTSYCTESEYQELQRWNRKYMAGPTEAQCTRKDYPATWSSCSDRGYSWGMTTEQMREHDKNATCATGTQIYWAENDCRLLADGKTYSDGSKLE